LVILPGIASSWKRNLPRNGNSARNIPLLDEEYTEELIIQQGFTSSWIRGNSAGNYLYMLMKDESTE
jgi:hypothetical protein